MDGLFRVGLPLEDIIRCLFFGVLIWFLGIIRVFSFLGMRCWENLSFFFVVFGNCFIYYLAGRGNQEYIHHYGTLSRMSRILSSFLLRLCGGEDIMADDEQAENEPIFQD